jgi:hypothetical protein
MTESPTTELDRLVSRTLESVERAIRHAYDMGRSEALSRLSAVLTELAPALTAKSPKPEGPASAAQTEGRAAQGTVKPAILALTGRPNGATAEEMAAIGIKFNSIRGTIYSLHKEGKIERHGDRWYAITPESYEAPSRMEGAS